MVKLITSLIDQYLEYVNVTKSKGMYEYEKSHLTVLKEYCIRSNIFHLNDLTEQKLYAFMNYLKEERDNSTITINKKLSAFKRVLHFSNVKRHPIFRIQKMKEHKKRFSVLTEDELKKIFDYCDHQANERGKIEQLVIHLFFETGVRLSELVAIEKKNINLMDHTIVLSKTKTNVERVVFFTSLTKQMMIDVMRQNHHPQYLVWNISKNKPYDKESIHAIFKRIKYRCKLELFHPHMFRHTFATKMIEEGMPITSLQIILGHSSVKTTEVYLHISLKKVHEDYNKIFNKT